MAFTRDIIAMTFAELIMELSVAAAGCPQHGSISGIGGPDFVGQYRKDLIAEINRRWDTRAPAPGKDGGE